MDISTRIYWLFKDLNMNKYSEKETIEKINNVLMSNINSELMWVRYYKLGINGILPGTEDDYVYRKALYIDRDFLYILCTDRLSREIGLFIYGKDCNIDDEVLGYYAITDE